MRAGQKCPALYLLVWALEQLFRCLRVNGYSGMGQGTMPCSVPMMIVKMWHRHLCGTKGPPPSEYIAWVYRELVNQGIDVLELPDRFRVLRDLVAWRDTFPNDAFAKSVCWNSFDLEMLVERSRTTKTIAKPRIEVSAEITTKRNLSVRWHPSGFHEAEDDGNRPMHSYNVVDPNAFCEPPDFQQFRGDESLSFESRPSNELMFIRGVGFLKMFIRGVGFLNQSPDRANATRRDSSNRSSLPCAIAESLLAADVFRRLQSLA